MRQISNSDEVYIVADLLIWASYLIICIFIISFVSKKPNIPIKSVFWLLGLLMLAGGITYLWEAFLFWKPVDDYGALFRVINALIAMITVIAVYKFYSIAMLMRTPAEFEKEIEERKKSEMKFMGLLESAPDSMVITDSKGKIIMVNAQTENIFGFNRNEIIGRDVETLIPKKFHHKHKNDRNVYMANPVTRPMGVDLELYGVRKDGTEFPVEISLSPLKTHEDNDIVVMAAIRDITRQKKAEAEIKQLNDNLEHLILDRTAELMQALQNEKTARKEMSRNQMRLEFLKDASEVLSSTLNYCEILVNLAKTVVPKIADWCIIYEYHEDGSLNLLVSLHADPVKKKFANELVEKFSPSPSVSRDVDQVVKSGEPILYHEITDDVIKSQAGDHEHLRLLREMEIKSSLVIPMFIREKLFGILILNITESENRYDEKDLDFSKEISRRAMLAIENARLYEESQKANVFLEERVARRTHELETINKELEAFSYSVSHDLRAPLRSIDGFSNKILKDYSALLDEQGRDYFMRVMRASQNMGRLIDDLLKLSRLSRAEIHPEITDISALVTTIVREQKIIHPERNVEFVVQNHLMAKVDRSLMQIALQNMIENAWKYTRNKPLARIEFSSFDKDGQTVFFIQDNGVGFDMKYVDKLFQSFQRLHGNTEFEGSGIGLAIVLRIIHRHHGTIWAEGEVNKGATFYFSL